MFKKSNKRRKAIYIAAFVLCLAIACVGVVPLFAAKTIIFDIAGGDVIINVNGEYSGYVNAGTNENGEDVYELVTGTHDVKNTYVVTGTYDTEEYRDVSSYFSADITGTFKSDALKTEYDAMFHNIQIIGTRSDINETQVNLVLDNLTIRNKAISASATGSKYSSSIYIPANKRVQSGRAEVGDQQKKVTISLNGTNNLDFIQYFTCTDDCDKKYDSASTLTITDYLDGTGGKSGVLNVGYDYEYNFVENSKVNNAAIGAQDIYSQCTGLIINGGTINATAYGMDSVIGAGSNGGATVEINGGKITANHYILNSESSLGTSGAAIGGGGGKSYEGCAVDIAISGENTEVYAYNHLVNTDGTIDTQAAAMDKGVSIGGGNTQSNTGGSATVNISGGTVVADSIGGGFSSSGNGGRAIIEVTGGIFTIAGNIGGGGSVSGYGGESDLLFTGGTVRADCIGAGFSQTYGYAEADIIITGGTLDSKITAQPTNGPENGSAAVYQTTVTLYENNECIENAVEFNVNSVACSYTYGTKDMYLDESSMLYLWVPNTDAVTEVQIVDKTQNSYSYQGHVPGSGTGALKSVLLNDNNNSNYSIRFPFDDRYKISYDPEGKNEINGILSAAMGDTISFYVHPKTDSNGECYIIEAYRSNDDTSTMDLFQPYNRSDVLYHYRMTVTADTEIIISTTDSNSNSRISLDLSQNPVALSAGNTAIGRYNLAGYGGSYMLTTGGLPTQNTLRVDSGVHNVYVNYLNVQSDESVVKVNGGTVNMTVSEFDNKAISLDNSPIYVEENAHLSIDMNTANSLELTTSKEGSAVIGGEGVVGIKNVGGFLNMHSAADEANATKIKAQTLSYTGSLSNGSIPYSFTITEGDFVGLYNGTGIVQNGDLTDESLTYTAFSISFVTPADMAQEPTYTIENGTLNIVLQEGYEVSYISRDGVKLSGTELALGDCYGHLLIAVEKSNASAISYSAEPVTMVYNAAKCVYNGIIVADEKLIVEYQYPGSDGWVTQPPSSTNVAVIEFQFRIKEDGQVRASGESTFTVVKGQNEWNLRLTCASILLGQKPQPNAVPKWREDDVIYTYRIVTNDGYVELGTETPKDEGFYAVKATVPASDEGNFDALESDWVYFTIDSATVFTTPGRDYGEGYQGMSGSTTITPNRDGEFTVYYGFLYLPDVEDKPLTFTFSKALPTGTTIALLNYHDSSLSTYNYKVTSSNVTDICSTDFVAMGAANTGFESAADKSVEMGIKLCFRLPEDTNEEFTINLTQGQYADNYSMPSLITVKSANIKRGTIELQSASYDDTGIVSAAVNIQTQVANNVVAIELLDENSNPAIYPPAVGIKLGACELIEVTGNVAYFKVATSDLYTLKIDFSNCSVSLSGNEQYQIRATLCEEPMGYMSNPMANAVSTNTANIIIHRYVPAITATLQDGESRFIKKALSTTLHFDVQTLGVGEVNVYVQKKKNGVYSECSTISVSQAGENKYNVTIPVLAEKGTYRIVFQKGNAVFNYNIILY